MSSFSPKTYNSSGQGSAKLVSLWTAPLVDTFTLYAMGVKSLDRKE